ncbi:MAG: SMI1/KNR4 family protein [Saprospiraceae bacterium]
MSQIVLAFNNLSNMQHSLLTDNYDIYNQGATNAEIKAVEIEFGTSFPQEMKDLYKYANGNKVYPDYFGSLHLIRGKFALLSLKEALKYYNNIDWEEYQDLYEPHLFPGDKLFPVLDGGKFDVFWIDLNPTSDNKNKIYYTNTLSTPHGYVFLSLENMIQTFNIAYERKIIFRSDEMIDIKYDEFFQLCFDQTGFDIWRNK